MKKCYITVTGLNHYYGAELFRTVSKVKLIKEPENVYDHEAIRVEVPGLGKVGYVANSAYTVLGECFSAGRLYDKIGDTATAKVKYIIDKGVVCKVKLGTEQPELLPLQVEEEMTPAEENEDITF